PTKYEEAQTRVAAGHRKELLTAEPQVFHLDKWDGSLSGRRFDVQSKDLTFECYGSPSIRKKLYIFLSAVRRTNFLVPAFHRNSWHPWFDGVCLNVDDPTYRAYAGRIETGWYLGSDNHNAIPELATLVQKVQAHYEIS